MQGLRKHIQKLLEEGVIETSTSQYASPMFLVPKPDDSCRAVVDFRAVNKNTEIESVPLPDVHSGFQDRSTSLHWILTMRIIKLH